LKGNREDRGSPASLGNPDSKGSQKQVHSEGNDAFFNTLLEHEEPPGYRRSRVPRRPTVEPVLPIIRQILDEFGYVPASKAGAELLFDVIGTAYERTSVILTTNLAFENWTEVLGNERLTGAALDRLTHRCHIVELTGESYRLQDAKRRRSSS
jgi:hypothetical protein